MTIYAKCPSPLGDKYYKLTVSQRWTITNDNGSLISTGLTVGVDLKQTQLDALIRQGKAVEISYNDWNHSGCQSSCTRRGDATCRW